MFTSLTAQAESPMPPSVATLGPSQVLDFKVKSVVGPSIDVDDSGGIHVAWTEEEKDVRTIRYARSTPQGTLGVSVPVNRADEVPYWRQEAPALASTGDRVFVTWALSHPKATAEKPFSSELRLSRSLDGGRTFEPSVRVNDDEAVANHSFDSLHLAPDGTLHIAWIDPRDGNKEPATYIARSHDHGESVAKNQKIDDHTCVCCRTAVTTAPDGALYVAWRKVFPGDVRETVVARSTDGGRTFSEPVIVGHDHWVFTACPHRPASIGTDAQGRLYVVWYTEGKEETPAVYIATSDDRGQTFSAKTQLNTSKGTFPDHPQMAVDGQGRVAVVWEEQSPVRREVVLSVSTDRGRTFTKPVKLNDKKGQTPSVAMNHAGTVGLAWMEHAMPAHRLIVQTLQFANPQTAAAEQDGAR
jgi:hypothetical protein